MAPVIAMRDDRVMMKLLLWLLLLVVAWPLALLALILDLFVWLLSLPFRVVGISVRAAFDTLEALIRLPARVLAGSKPR